MCEFVVKCCGKLNFIKYFVNLFQLICQKIGFKQIKSNQKEILIDKPEIINKKIKYNKFGYPFYTNRDKSNKN